MGAGAGAVVTGARVVVTGTVVAGNFVVTTTVVLAFVGVVELVAVVGVLLDDPQAAMSSSTASATPIRRIDLPPQLAVRRAYGPYDRDRAQVDRRRLDGVARSGRLPRASC